MELAVPHLVGLLLGLELLEVLAHELINQLFSQANLLLSSCWIRFALGCSMSSPGAMALSVRD